MDDMTLESLMSREVVTIGPDMPVSTLVAMMDDQEMSCVLVVEDELPVGIVTERDIVHMLADSDGNVPPGETPVRQVMSSPLISLTPDCGLFSAMVVATSQGIRHLPVVDEQGLLVGLVTQSDLARAEFEMIEHEEEIIRDSVDTQTRELRAANDRLAALSMEDPLLGIGNRRAMEVDLEHTHHLAVRGNRPYSVVLFDIDHFKRFNDRFGHPAGDRVLEKVAQTLAAAVRASDRIYRYGGEEILALLPDTPPEGALIIAERMAQGVEDLAIEHPDNPQRVVTVSGGIGTGQSGLRKAKSWREVVIQADKGLYRAKNSGRNQIALVA